MLGLRVRTHESFLLPRSAFYHEECQVEEDVTSSIIEICKKSLRHLKKFKVPNISDASLWMYEKLSESVRQTRNHFRYVAKKIIRWLHSQSDNIEMIPGIHQAHIVPFSALRLSAVSHDLIG